MSITKHFYSAIVFIDVFLQFGNKFRSILEKMTATILHHFELLQNCYSLEYVNIVIITMFYNNYNLCKEALCTHEKKLQIFFKQFMNMKFLREIL